MARHFEKPKLYLHPLFGEGRRSVWICSSWDKFAWGYSVAAAYAAWKNYSEVEKYVSSLR